MALKNEYVETIKKFNRLSIVNQNVLLREVTANQMTPDLKDAVRNLQIISGVGDVTSRAILFAIGINLE